MNWKRSCLDCLGLLHLALRGGKKALPKEPRRIFVLRNNDIGDLLVTTPIFEVLKRGFPQAELIAGIGDWNRDVLKENPWIDRVLSVNAPWHNKFTGKRYSTIPGVCRTLTYILTSPEVTALRNINADVGIDITGCWESVFFLNKAGITATIGVKGYGGGHLSSTAYVTYDPLLYVGQASLNQAHLLGATELPEARPQIYLTEPEKAEARERWQSSFPAARPKVLICPGAGYTSKCRSPLFFHELIRRLQANAYSIALSGSAPDTPLGEELARTFPGVVNWCGQLSLRQAFAAVATSDIVVCHSSMALHTAAAFKKPTVLLLTAIYNVEEHQRTWGYPYPCLTLGPQAGLDDREEAARTCDQIQHLVDV